jgi:hypothetical protein
MLTMLNNILHHSRIAAVALGAMLATLPALAQDDINPINVVMDRFHADTYQAGQPIEIQVRIGADGGNLTAMGLRETIPPNWTFMGMQGVTGDVPAVSPSPGEQGLLEFAWITVPQLPYTFSYTLQVPEDDAGGTQVFHGALEYRLDSGAQYAAPVITSVNGAPDTQPPVITLTGGANISIEVGGAWSEPGYSARDNVDGDLTGSVTVSGNVNSSVAGTYALTYAVSDRAGNRGTAERVVTVSAATNGGGTGGGGTAGPVTTPRAGAGVGNGTGTSRTVNNTTPDARRTADAKAAKAAQAAKLAAKQNAPANAAAAEAGKGGSLQMRPGVHGGQDPAAGVVIPGATGTPGGGDPGAPGPRADTGDSAGAPDATQVDSGGEEGKKLSDAWPSLDGTDPAKVAQLGAQSGTAPDGSVEFGPKSTTANIMVLAAVAAVILIGIGGSMFAARSVYGGRRRRVAPPRQT